MYPIPSNNIYCYHHESSSVSCCCPAAYPRQLSTSLLPQCETLGQPQLYRCLLHHLCSCSHLRCLRSLVLPPGQHLLILCCGHCGVRYLRVQCGQSASGVHCLRYCIHTHCSDYLLALQCAGAQLRNLHIRNPNDHLQQLRFWILSAHQCLLDLRFSCAQLRHLLIQLDQSSGRMQRLCRYLRPDHS